MPRTADIPNSFIAVTDIYIPPSARIVETQEGFDVIESAKLIKRGETMVAYLVLWPPAARILGR